MAKLSTAPVKNQIKKIPGAAKTAPEKIVRSTLEAAIKSVEKAAAKEVKKTAAAAEKKALKATKAMSAATHAQKLANDAAKRAASALSSPLKSNKKQAASRLTNKIKHILSPDKEEVFYYDRRCLIALSVCYALLSCLVWVISNALICAKLPLNPVLFIFLTLTQILTLAAFASAVFVMLFPQHLAVITNKSIKIDHNVPLKWEDVELAEEKYTSYITRRPIMALHLKQGASYKLTFMQKLCQNNVFTPFSLPLYAMRPEDVKKIRALIKEYAKYQDARD